MTETQNAQSAVAPTIQMNQIDSGSLGDVNNSVNLYRGEVNLPLTIVSLPGREGLDVKVSAFYSSNVHQQVNTWNKEAPTGVLGVGWNLLTSKIVVDFKETSSYYDGVFYLVLEGKSHELKRISKDADGAIIYETIDFNFIKIKYYPSEEKWIVVNEVGLVHTFGGDILTPGEPIMESAFNRCGFGVSWDNWIGSSTQSEGKKMFVKQWNLGIIENLWNEQITYQYDTTDVNIGGGDAFYTQSTRIKSITDVNNRFVQFNYQPKEGYEIQFPEIPPSQDLHAYQFNYETYYLKDVAVYVDSQLTEQLSKITLDYEPFNVSQQDGGNFKKRYLTSIIQQNDEVENDPSNVLSLSTKPGIALAYYTDPISENPGAIESILYPNGALAHYSYETKPLSGVNTKKVITAPSGYDSPTVTYGSDYVVVTWESKRDIYVSVYTWVGEWIAYSKTIQLMRASSHSSVSVKTEGNFFALLITTINNPVHDRQIRLFHKDVYKVGDWIYKAVGKDQGVHKIEFVLGRDFIAIAQKQSYYRNNISWFAYSWDVLKKDWVLKNFRDSFEVDYYSLAARDNYFCLLSKDVDRDVKIFLYYKNEQGTWVNSPNSGEFLPNTNGSSHLSPGHRPYLTPVVAGGNTFIAFSYVYRASQVSIDYAARIFNWDENFKIIEDSNRTANTAYTFTLNRADYSFQRPIIRGNLVGTGNKVNRYDGQNWILDDLDQGDHQFINSYGADCGIKGTLNVDTFEYAANKFNPYTLEWEQESLDFTDLTAPMSAGNAPTVSGNYRTINKNLQYRDNHLNWNSVEGLDQSDFTQLTNQAPKYLSNPNKTFFLANGAVQGQGTTSQKIIAGGTAFISYNSSKAFSNVKTFNLYHATFNLEKSASNPINYADTNLNPMNAAVAKMTIQNGSQKNINNLNETIDTYYEYDWSNALYDPFGRVAQFEKITVFKGDKDKYGQSEYQFFAGQPEADSGLDYPSETDSNIRDFYSLFAGQLYKKLDYNEDNVLVGELTNYMSAFESADRYGAYLRTTKKVNTIDELSTTSEMDYNEKGQLSKETLFNTDSYGDAIEIIKTTKYGWEESVYSDMLTINLLNPIIENRVKVVNTTKSKTTKTGSSATTWRNDWLGAGNGKQWAPAKNYLWDGSTNADSFDFNKYGGSEESPTGWSKLSEIYSRNENGLVIETIDAEGKFSTGIYDKNQHFPIAQFLNADQSEAFYAGFEAYENLADWVFINGESYSTADVFTGKRSVSLSNNQQIERVISPTNNSQDYQVGLWVKTAPDFIESNDTYLSYLLEGQQGVDFTIKPTNGNWEFQAFKINLARFQASPNKQLQISLFNAKEEAILVDNIFCCPILGDFAASVFETKYVLQKTILGKRGEAKRIVYDPYQAPILNTGNDGQVQDVTTKYRWRNEYSGTISPDNIFNYDIAAKVKEKSSLYEFKNEAWRNTWEPDGPEWSLNENQQLVCNADRSVCTLNLKNDLEENSFIFRFQLDYYQKTSIPYFVLEVGNVTIRYIRGRWDLLEDDFLLATNEQVGLAGECFIIATQESLLFFADEQLVFNFVARDIFDNGKKGLSLTTRNYLTMDYIMLAFKPVTGLSFLDNTGKIIQSQVLDINKCTVKGIYYNHIGQPIIKTKPVIYENNVFIYQPTLVTNINQETGELSGDASNHYKEDNGYPYASKRFERSPLSRLLETGAPGSEYAIHPDDPSNDHTIHIGYQAQTPIDFFPDLPAEKYQYRSITNQDGLQSAQLKDMMGNTIAECKGMVNGVFGEAGSVVTRNLYDVYGNHTTVLYPNAYEDGNQPNLNTSPWAKRMEYDFAGRVISEQSADEATPTLILYDVYGRPRFKKDPLGNQFYYAYDVLGRKLEEGSTSEEWNVLENNAKNPSYSLPASKKTVIRQYEYGGASNEGYGVAGGCINEVEGNTNGIGKLTRVYYKDNPNQYIAYTYNLNGQMLAVQDTKNDSNFGYTYNNGGDIKTITDLDNTNDYFVGYNYANNGRLLNAAMTTDGHTATVDYEYNEGGGIAHRAYGSTSQESFGFQESMEYNSKGWLKSISSPYFNQTLSYEGYYSGKIAEITDDFQGLTSSEFINSSKSAFEYNNLGQIREANMDYYIDQAPQNLLVFTPSSYDPNGNILGWNTGSNVIESVYNTNTNQVKNTIGNNSTVYGYYANGNTKKTHDITNINWDAISQQPETLKKVDLEEVDFQYNQFGQRVLKTIGRKVTDYGMGLNNVVLRRIEKEKGKVTSKKYYLYGPKGLLIISNPIVAGQPNPTPFNCILKDHEGSTRVVVDTNNTVLAAFNYMLFGDTLGAVYGDATACHYQYTGQELDIELGTYNYKNRIYDPFLGRFYSLDPKMQFPSPYIYANNDPILYTDYTGEWSRGAKIGLALGILQVAAGVALLVTSAIVTGGVATAATGIIAGGLIGSGVAGMTNSIANKDNFNTGNYVKQSLLGGAVGLITAGVTIGVGAALGSSAAASIGIGQIGKAAGTFVTASAVNFTGTFAQDTISAKIDGESINWGKVLTDSAISGALGGVFDLAGSAGKGLRGGVNNTSNLLNNMKQAPKMSTLGILNNSLEDIVGPATASTTRKVLSSANNILSSKITAKGFTMVKDISEYSLRNGASAAISFGWKG